MSLFSYSTLGLPIKLDRESLQSALSHHDHDTGRRSSYLRSPGDDTAGEFHVNLLLWELESQMKRYQEVKRQKLVHSRRQGETNGPQAGTSVSYEWLRRDAPKSRELDVSRDTMRAIRELCRETRPGDLDRLRSTFTGVLAAREPPPEDVPMIFAEVLKSFSSDSRQPKRKVGKLRAALNLLGTLRRLMKPNRVEPTNDTEKPFSPRVLEGTSPCREHLFLARREHLHCLINLEDEFQPSDFALSLYERQTIDNSHKETGDDDLEMQLRVGRMAWQSSKEDVPCDTARKPDYGANKPLQDMEVIDLVSNSSSEEALLATSGPTSPIHV